MDVTLLTGPHGHCPCGGLLATITYYCMSEEGGDCMVSHPGLRCCKCNMVWEKVSSLRPVDRKIKVVE